MRSKPFFIITTLVLLGSSLISLYLASSITSREASGPLEFKTSTSSYISDDQQSGNASESSSEDFQPRDIPLENKFASFAQIQSGNNNSSSHFETDQVELIFKTPVSKPEDELDDDEEEYTLEDFDNKYEFHSYLQWKEYLGNVEKLQNQLLAKRLLIEKNIDTKTDDFHLSQNPYKLLGLYGSVPAHYYNLGPKSRYNEGISLYLAIIRNPEYCQEVDLYHLANQNTLFESLKIVGDQVYDEALIRTDVFPQFGFDAVPELKSGMDPDLLDKPIHMLPLNATTFFFKRVNIHQHYELGREMACHSQFYNHIPGNGVLTRKDLIAKHANDYIQLYTQKPQCLKDIFFPLTYQLNVTSECIQFFDLINSQEYHAKKSQEPIQFLLKKGHGAHRATGVFLFDQEVENELRKTYQEGQLCGQVDNNTLAQQYISNPLTLDKQNKFDFRIYMLVASVKPLVVYYHDGFLRLSLSKYDKFSREKNVHLTNTHLSKEIFNQTTEENLHQGMNEEELRDYQMWLMEDLQNYLLSIGKIQDENWLENSLRPMFKKAFIHLMRMTESALYQVSNVFELFGLDFVLDEDLNLWFIECNASPQLIASNDRKKTFLVKMLADLFELQSAYYKSRMSRTFKFMEKMVSQINNSPDSIDYSKFKAEFDSSIDLNKLEPEFTISPTNGFSLILDKNIKGDGAYFGHIEKECINFN